MLVVLLIAGAAMLVGLTILGRSFGSIYFKYRGDRVINCPQNRQLAGVRVNASHAMFTALEGKPDLRLQACSRWPERQDCGQECLRQVETAQEDCLVRHILTKWYKEKTCALCGRPIGEITWAEHKPALLSHDHRTVQWQDVQPEQVPDVLASHRVVCWNCHIVNTMVMAHPDLLVDRARHI